MSTVQSEKKVYGIDLGTTYSAIATLDEHLLPQIIENQQDASPLLASAVYFGGGEPTVGVVAKNQKEIEPDKVVEFVKRVIGKEGAPKWIFDGVGYTPVTISAEILKRMKTYAEEQTGETVEHVIITVPARFNIAQCNATRQAGEIAGLDVLNLVKEPTAAALSYCSREYQEDRKILVYDLGGGTFDVTLLDFSVDGDGKAKIKVIASDGDFELGGIDWDNILFDYVSNAYADEAGIDIDDLNSDLLLRQQIRSQIEDVKKSLSTMPNRAILIKHAKDATRIDVSREKFERLTERKVEETMAFVHKLLSDTGTAVGDIDVVLLVGGSTMMPMIKNTVGALFPGKVRIEDPHKAVAKGAALAAAIDWNEKVLERIEEIRSEKDAEVSSGEITETEEKLREQLINVPGIFQMDEPGKTPVTDVLSCSFGPGVIAGKEYTVNNLMFKGGDAPATASATYYTMSENQDAVKVRIFQNVSCDEYVTPSIGLDGEKQETEPELEVGYVGEVNLPLPPHTPEGSPVEVTFYFSTTLDVTVRNPNTGDEEPGKFSV